MYDINVPKHCRNVEEMLKRQVVLFPDTHETISTVIRCKYTHSKFCSSCFIESLKQLCMPEP